MKLEWFEDLLALYEADSLTAAAARRNISQPAFSRRIQMLEVWLGIELTDRNRKPTVLTRVAREQEAAIRSMIGGIYEFRAAVRAQTKSEGQISIAAQHSLSAQPLLKLIKEHAGRARLPTFRLSAGDRQNCIAQFLRGDADILYCYENPAILDTVQSTIAKTITVGYDQLVMVGSPSLVNKYKAKRTLQKSLPLIIYPRESFFGGLLWTGQLTKLMTDNQVDVICVTAFAQGILDLVLASIGFAWLPRRMIDDLLKSGALCEANLAGDPPPLKIVAAVKRQSMNNLSSLLRRLSVEESDGESDPQ